MENAFPAIEDLVPHRAPLLQLDAVTGFADQLLTAVMRVRPDSIFVAEGAMPAWVGIELMAQAIAAYAGVEAWRRGEEVKKGFLLGTRDYKAQVPAFAVDQELTLTAHPLYREDSGLGAFECRILAGDTVLVEARLNVFEPPDFQAFVSQREVQ